MYVSSFCYVQVLKHQYSETYTQLIGVYLLPSVDCKAGSTMEWQHGSTWEQKEFKMEFGLSKLTFTQTYLFSRGTLEKQYFRSACRVFNFTCYQ